MSLSRFLLSYVRTANQAWTMWRLRATPPRQSLERSNWDSSLRDPTAFYLECARDFQQRLRPEFRQHRAYFHNVANNRRGFGEDAFHVMWELLLNEFKPARFLEIGVYRGQVISLVGLWAKLNGRNCEIWGISPFSGAGDSTSNYRRDFDYLQDTLQNFDHFSLPHPTLIRAYSTDAEAVQAIRASQWDMIYIDGNHDYEIVLKDWDVCSRSLKPGGIVVLDDSGMTEAYHPPSFATAGLPGPSRLANEMDRSRFREILQVGHNRAFQKISP